ncbi:MULTISPECIES: cysteine desulfurase family protein [unclassified Paenibacillus]|uniref:cysteine desulfurase family protein n=1 Tax=unclassified Paenibacillus TaxID=185978 RepID=UPI001AE7999D|nr:MULTISPECIES: cysteine desulfurase family protein [unclassified Paenibacillus]MBP1156308.1 cysteine desulfurase [Paenibacillus sp. PvP091]MBP1168306.1 cysteine desulfurase [Paenibacillus sp. PvR098]MBP2439334.1 cysteine desulfurase [Paenibacillus sp. PvP052]
MLYMDYAATTPMYEEVIDTMTEVMRKFYGNPSSLHAMGADAEQLVARARQTIAAMLKCAPGEIRFTSGGTESNNLAIRGAAGRYRHRGNHLITSMVEHASVYETFRRLEAEGYQVTYLPVDETGQIRLNDLKKALKDETILVSVMHVNNEMGRIQPMEQIGQLLRERPKTLFHVDAVQSVGKLPVIPERLGADLLTCAAHKLRGPKGIGFLYCRRGVELEPLLHGGGQEEGFRSGTENVPAIVGMAKAVRMAMDEQQAFAEHTAGLRKELVRCISTIPELVLSGSKQPEDMAPHIVHFSYPGMKSEVLVHALEQRGVCVSARSACSSGAEKPSRVLLAMGASHAAAVSGIRLSYSLQQTHEDALRFCSALQEVVAELKPAASQKGRRNS